MKGNYTVYIEAKEISSRFHGEKSLKVGRSGKMKLIAILKHGSYIVGHYAI